MKTTVIVATLLALVSGAPARAADICEAVALQPVPALEAPESILKPGEVDAAITQYRVSKKDARVTVCSHGGYCYPMQVLQNGIMVEALRLTNCKVGKRDPDDDPDNFYYQLDVIRSKVPPGVLKVDDIDNKLLEIGLCSSCAGNAAYLYVHQPRSRCAVLVKRALEGEVSSARLLTENFPTFCESR